MQILKSLGLFTLFFCLSLFIISCGASGGHSHEGHNHEVHHGEGKAYNAAYVCPMHCDGSGSHEAGTCPACGMDYVQNADHTSDGHTH